jgi:hypothetical protein
MLIGLDGIGQALIGYRATTADHFGLGDAGGVLGGRKEIDVGTEAGCRLPPTFQISQVYLHVLHHD